MWRSAGVKGAAYGLGREAIRLARSSCLRWLWMARRRRGLSALRMPDLERGIQGQAWDDAGEDQTYHAARCSKKSNGGIILTPSPVSRAYVRIGTASECFLNCGFGRQRWLRERRAHKWDLLDRWVLPVAGLSTVQQRTARPWLCNNRSRLECFHSIVAQLGFDLSFDCDQKKSGGGRLQYG